MLLLAVMDLFEVDSDGRFSFLCPIIIAVVKVVILVVVEFGKTEVGRQRVGEHLLHLSLPSCMFTPHCIAIDAASILVVVACASPSLPPLSLSCTTNNSGLPPL